MATDPSTPDHSLSTRFRSVAGNVLGGGFAGAIAGFMLLPYLLSLQAAQAVVSRLGWNITPADSFWLTAGLGAAIGVVGGVIWGQITRAREARHTAALQKVAASLGASFSPSNDPELSEKLARLFPASEFTGMCNVIRTQMQGIRFAVGDVSVTKETGTGTDSTTKTVEQTAAYYESDTSRFPKFTLQPEGFMTKMFSRATGIEDINFPAHPEFSRAYYLSAVHAENTRRLFNGLLLEGLGRRQGLYVESDSGSLIIYRPGKLCAAEELKGFVGEAAEIFRLFEDSARKSALTAETVLTAKVDVKALAEKMPGLMGKIARATLVTRADVEAFVRQPPPRTIPANILRYRDKFVPGFVVLIGIVFAVAGAAFAVAFGYEALAGGKGLMSGGVFIGLTFLAVGGCIAYFAGRVRIRIKRLLRNGRIGAGSIEKIGVTSGSINGQAVSLMTVQYRVEGRSIQASCDLMGDAVERAQKFMVNKKPVPILYDPANPRRILLVESLLNVSTEYEP